MSKELNNQTPEDYQSNQKPRIIYGPLGIFGSSLTYSSGENQNCHPQPALAKEKTIDFSQMEKDFPVGFFSGARKYLNGTFENVSKVIKRK